MGGLIIALAIWIAAGIAVFLVLAVSLIEVKLWLDYFTNRRDD